MPPYTIAIAGRYPDRHAMRTMLAEAKLDTLPAVIQASWLNVTAESDGDLSDDEARAQVSTNMREILSADLLLYVPSWTRQYPDLNPRMPWHTAMPLWSPGRLIDIGIALGNLIPVLIVGRPEHSIYFRGMPWCAPEELRGTVERMMSIKDA